MEQAVGNDQKECREAQVNNDALNATYAKLNYSMAMVHEVISTYLEAAHATPAQPDETELVELRAQNERLRLALTIADGTAPCSKWKTHQGVNSLEDFAAWVDHKLREYLLLAAESKDPELGDWLAARKGTFEEVKLNLTRALSALSPTRDDSGLAPLKPSEELLWILGQPNFACAGTANGLRAAGQEIHRKAEAEQAAVLLWMLNLYLEHGEQWRDAGIEFLDKAVKAAQAKAGAV